LNECYENSKLAVNCRFNMRIKIYSYLWSGQGYQNVLNGKKETQDCLHSFDEISDIPIYLVHWIPNYFLVDIT